MRARIGLALLLLGAMWVEPAAAEDSGLQHVNVGYAFVASTTLPVWIARDEGLYKKYGLDVKLFSFQGSAAATQALLGGSLDIVFGSADAVVTVVGRGAPAAVIGTTQLLNYELVARPDFTSVAELRGRTAGISAFSGGDDFALRRLLPKFGLQPGKDVRIVVLGTPNSYQKDEAVLNGTIDATLSSFDVVDTLKLQGKKMSVLAETLPNGVKLTVGDLFTTRAYLANHGANVANFMRAYVAAIRMAKNSKALTYAYLKKYTRVDNPVIQEETYKRRILGEFQSMPWPNEEAILAQRDDIASSSPDLARLKGMNAAAFIDAAPLKTLEAQGFLKSLPPLKPE